MVRTYEHMNRLLVICGPTATGKTALAATLAKKFNGELISADSRQVYKEMDLVTGKDRPDVPIWLYDIVNPDEEFSVSHWTKLANQKIADILERHKLPIVVGGSGLYIKALLYPFDTIDIPPNTALRARLYTLSVAELQAQTARGDMNQSDWNNPRRLIRKIEIEKSKRIFQKKLQTFDYCLIGLTASLPILDKRIDKRFKERLRQGMNKEVEVLVQKYGREFPSMSAIGLNEHAYVRRQMTWFKKQKDIHWFDVTDQKFPDNIAELVAAWYTCR